jgi:hypothetical protein
MMATTTGEVEQLYNRMLIPLGIIYTKFISDGRGPTGPGAGLKKPETELAVARSFSEIPLKFGPIMGHQLGIFLGDLASEQHMYDSYDTTRTTVIINVDEVNKFAPNINANGVAILIAHELGHAYRWYMGHVGGNGGYTNEIWARTLELAYVEALRTSIHAEQIGVNFSESAEFIKKYRKSLYRLSEGEKKFYTELTGDSAWEVTKKSVTSMCPKGDPDCFKPPQIAMLHVSCKPG